MQNKHNFQTISIAQCHTPFTAGVYSRLRRVGNAGIGGGAAATGFNFFRSCRETVAGDPGTELSNRVGGEMEVFRLAFDFGFTLYKSMNGK